MTLIRMTLPTLRTPNVKLFNRLTGSPVGNGGGYNAIAKAYDPMLYEIDVGNVVGDLELVSTNPIANGFVNIPAARDSTQILFASSEYRADSSTLSSILALLQTTPIVIQPPVFESGQIIRLTRGDTYNDVRKPRIRFPVTKDYAGCTINLTIRHRKTDVVLMALTNGARESATSVYFPTVGPPETTFPLLAIGDYGLHNFDLEAVDGSSNKETIVENGKAILVLDQTR